MWHVGHVFDEVPRGCFGTLDTVEWRLLSTAQNRLKGRGPSDVQSWFVGHLKEPTRSLPEATRLLVPPRTLRFRRRRIPVSQEISLRAALNSYDSRP